MNNHENKKRDKALIFLKQRPFGYINP